VHDLLLQRSDGAFELVVWGERVKGTNTVTVDLGGTWASVRIYDPTVGITPAETLSNTSLVRLALSDHPVILEIPTRSVAPARPQVSPAEVPSKIPRRRATQLLDGFGVNLDLPRRPRMPWTKTWTPLFDSGAKWVRIGQYENSSEKISWDWVEQTPGHYAVPEDAEEAVRSLLDNGVSI
jgi:hypothetical protein